VPAWSIRFVQTALAALATGFGLGAVLLLARAGVVPSVPAWLRPAHAEILLVGWFVQLVLGVAWWIFPRHVHGPPRGSPRIMPVAFVLLNGGLLLFVAGLAGSSPLAVLTGRAAEWVAVLAVAAQLITRVRGSRLEQAPR
jgi:heme/copper-type cytochrome/quinol oxidase subunit 1